MDDHNEALRKAWIARLSEYVDSLQERRQHQIDKLGERCIFHPENAPRKGSYNPLTGAPL